MKSSKKLLIILGISLIALVICLPTKQPVQFTLGPLNINTTISRPEFKFSILGKTFEKDLSLKQGLDLKGGTHVLLKADMSQIPDSDKASALLSAKEIIARRVDLFGVNEPMIQTSVNNDEYRLIVELAGVGDINTALKLIGETAQLDFRELPQDATESASYFDFVPTQLSGKHLKRSMVSYGQDGAPQVNIEFNSEGSQLFSDITGRNIGRPVGIFLDQFPVTAPRVQQQIIGGQAVISGGFTLDEAKNLSIQLNAGALPVPIEIIEQRNIGPTLGQESINNSVKAGVIGLVMVMVFMVLSYGRLGIIANIALVIYGLLTLALYKLIPVTLTLPGIAGFVLSVGMAVDSNILIFERMKEELRLGKPWSMAMELGFGRAWDSIKDANIATLITAFILFNPFDWSILNTSGMVRGFALTLSLGIAISLFTGIIVTRTLMRAFYKQK